MESRLVEFFVVDSLTGERLRGAVAESLRKVFFGTGANYLTRHSRCQVSVTSVRGAAGKWQRSQSKNARHVYVTYREIQA